MASLKDRINQTFQRIWPSGAAFVSPTHPYVLDADGGRYRWHGSTGLLPATTAADVILLAVRNPSATKTMILDYLRVSMQPDTDFTTQQRIGAYARVARGFTANPGGGGGSPVDLTLNKGKKKTTMATSLLSNTNAFIAGTTAPGAPTISAEEPNPFLEAVGHAPAAGTTVQNILAVDEFIATRDGGPFLFKADEGFVVRNRILLGAAGTVQVHIAMAWREVLNVDAANL